MVWELAPLLPRQEFCHRVLSNWLDDGVRNIGLSQNQLVHMNFVLACKTLVSLLLVRTKFL